MSKLAQQLIEREKRKRTGYLNLGNCGLTEMPDLSELEGLETLILSNWYLDQEQQKVVVAPNMGGLNRLHEPPIHSLPAGLKKIVLSSLKLRDGSFLKTLTSLTFLDLGSNLISDWSFIEKLTNLTSLDIHSNKISDASSIAKLTNLTSLDLSDNQIVSWSFLEKLTKLTSLELRNNKISDASAVAKLTSITSLDLRNNKISNASFLEKLTKLTSLELRNNKISDASAVAKLTSLTSLGLRNNKISNASFLKNLTDLIFLDLLNNKISDASSVTKLTSLTSLDLSHNEISDASFLTKLTKLTSLNLIGNQISDWSFAAKLTNLTSLNLSHNKISDASFLENLTNLTSLDLSYNKISDASFLENLTSLTSLDLSYNKISEYCFVKKLKIKEIINIFPINPYKLSGESYTAISELFPNNPKSLKELINNTFIISDSLFYHSVNDFDELIIEETDKDQEVATLFDKKIPGLLIRTDNITDPPPSVIKQGHQAILEYFRQKEKTGAAPLLEAKLILLGDGRAGKTSLANRMLNKPLPQEADRTPGVEIIIGEYGFPTANGPFKLHIWDFAGQDKYKPLHQFFYTEDAVYVMVADSGNAQTDFDDWLQTAELFGTGSPLLVVLNEFREGIGYGIFDAEHWKKRFPHLLKEVHLTNLLTGQGLEVIQKDIRHFAEKLPHTQQAYPRNWAAIREELERRRDENFISFTEYLKICREHDLHTKESALILSGILHKIGVCLHYQQSDLLRQHVILKNEWATQAVYKILEDQQVAEVKKGFFCPEDLRRVWSEEAYCEMRPQLLALMQQFRMAYPLPNSQEYVTPPLLPPAPPPGWEFPAGEALELYVEYELLPKALLTQFIVVRHTDIDCGRTLVWRNGVVLRWSADTLAEVVKTKSQGRDAFYVRARGSNRKGLLTSLLKTLRDLHGEYKGIKFAELVPCPCRGCREKRNKQHYFDFDNLRNRLERGRRVVECDKSLEEIELVKLLGDLLVFDVLAAGQPVVLKDVKNDTPPPAPRVPLAFFSYSKHDAAFLTEFQKHLRPLERSNRIRLWDDRNIRPGEEWDAGIKEALATADIIFLLLSPDFLATNYIVETEVAGAMTRHENGEAKIIPVKIRPCAWEDTPFSKLQVLPRKDKVISTAGDRDTAWLEVLAEIRQEIRHWRPGAF